MNRAKLSFLTVLGRLSPPLAILSLPSMATSYDRASALKAFDETKLGVKGLVDSGITKVPQFFIQPREQGDLTSLLVEIPVIDLTGVDVDAALRSEVVKKVKSASQTMGFFQVQKGNRNIYFFCINLIGVAKKGLLLLNKIIFPPTDKE
jgi:hypothetical protein